MLIQLLRPFSYLTIWHPSSLPKWVNWWAPMIASAALVGTAWCFHLNIDVLGSNGAVSRFLGFVQSLPGFYLAALAAIATFTNPDMQKLMPGIAPTMRIIYNGAPTVVELTRRRFLTAMFAFLTASSILITLFSITALAIAEPVKNCIAVAAHSYIKATFSFFYMAIVLQMLTVTMWGLYYLGERVHTPD